MTDIVNWAKQALRLGNVTFLVVILSVGVALLFVRPRWGRRWMVAIALLYFVLSTPLGSTLFIAPLTYGFHPIEDSREASSAGAIVVLGGGSRDLKSGAEALPYPYPSTILRAFEAARVFRRLDGRPIVVASGGTPGVDQRTPEGEVVADLLARLGVPRDRIIIEDRSLTTHEQAILVTRMLKSRGIERFVLVTSPTHMSRSIAVFRAQQADVVPSVAALIPERSQPPPFFMPNSESLGVSDSGIYDYAGLLYYWARGWLRPTTAQAGR